METIFRRGYQRQEIQAAPAKRNNNIWNSFSCAYSEVDFLRHKYKKRKKIYDTKK